MAFSIQKLSAKSGVARSAPKRSAVCAVAKSTGHWRPGSEWPAHLKNSNLAGNHGFDPLNLGADPQTLKWYVQSELVHGRTAMTAVAGILIPSILTKAGVLNVPEWYNAGKAYIESPGAIPFNSLVISTVLMCQFVELKRWEDYKVPGSQAEKGSFFGLEGAFKGKENGYPGGPFDPLGLASGTPASVEDYKEKELKNGRVAMLAFLGFACQYLATGKGPIDNLIDHINNPWGTTFASNGVSVPFF